jgi:hypothetical protein
VPNGTEYDMMQKQAATERDAIDIGKRLFGNDT